jgi:tetratricopeptide (TPR) repeat protein
MIAAPDLDADLLPATAGDIAVNNLQSACERSWSQFWQAHERPGIAEYIVQQEHLKAQFLGDLEALDRLGTLTEQLRRADPESMRTALIGAQVASMAHRFADGRGCLALARSRGAPAIDVTRLSLSIDQACGTGLDAVLAARRRMATESGRLEDLVPLGALLADLREFDEADRTYRRALRAYQDVSPFALAWVCFQIGALWGELVPEPQTSRAARWYRRAIDYLPCYVTARVHLAEILLGDGLTADARALLAPVVSSGDPEVHWRLGDVLSAMGRPENAYAHIDAARSGFESLLGKHLLAFADHGAEFYSGSGNDASRALELATINVANRPTLRAFEQAHAIAVGAGERHAASRLCGDAKAHWGKTVAFGLSSLATCRCDLVK